MKIRFFRACFQITACVVALQVTLQTQEKPRFSAEVVVRSVPAVERELGITKIYDIVLVNKSGDTLFVNQCEFTDDTLHKDVVTPFELQRWNQETKRWDTVLAHSPDYCRGSRWTQARAIRTDVPPGQKLEVNGDFVGANDPFSYGDRARFLVFLHVPGDYGDVADSPEFQLDEHRNKPPQSPPKVEPPKVAEPKIVIVRRSEASTEYLLDVSFLTPDVSNESFNYVSVYGTRIVDGQRSNDKEYLFLHGDWKPNERVKFSVRVPKESIDPAKGWILSFCVGSATPNPAQPGTLTLKCYPSANVLTKIPEDDKAQRQ
jgi:hypothetical protein